MAAVSAVASLQNFNLSSVQGPLVARAAVGTRNAMVIKARTHFMAYVPYLLGDSRPFAQPSND
jgi:hypothetical protein